MAWTNSFSNMQIQNISAFSFYDDSLTASYAFPAEAVQEASISIEDSGVETQALGHDVRTAHKCKLEVKLYFDELSDADVTKLKATLDIRDDPADYFYLIFERGAVDITTKFYNAIATYKQTVTLNKLIIITWTVEAETYDYDQFIAISEA